MVFYALVLAAFLRAFVVQGYGLSSESMAPALLRGDHVLVNRFVYGVTIPGLDRTIFSISRPQAGDVIVHSSSFGSDKANVRRVAAVAGQTVQIQAGALYIDGRRTFTFPAFAGRQVDPATAGLGFGPVTVPEGHVFALGDNPEFNLRGRPWGLVDLARVHGKAFLIYWSWNGAQRRVRWSRLSRLVD